MFFDAYVLFHVHVLQWMLRIGVNWAFLVRVTHKQWHITVWTAKTVHLLKDNEINTKETICVQAAWILFTLVSSQSTPFENAQRWMGKNTFPILLLTLLAASFLRYCPRNLKLCFFNNQTLQSSRSYITRGSRMSECMCCCE